MADLYFGTLYGDIGTLIKLFLTKVKSTIIQYGYKTKFPNLIILYNRLATYRINKTENITKNVWFIRILKTFERYDAYF